MDSTGNLLEQQLFFFNMWSFCIGDSSHSRDPKISIQWYPKVIPGQLRDKVSWVFLEVSSQWDMPADNNL